MSKLFSTIRELTSSYSRSFTPVQDSGSVPVDGASSVNENDQQAEPHVRRSSPFTLSTTAQAGPMLRTTRFPHGPPSIAAHVSETDTADLEPDEEWKRQLKAQIRLELQYLVQEAKDSQFTALKKADVTPEDRKQIDIKYKAALASIRQRARDQYQTELEKERDQRWWTAGGVEQGHDQLAVTASITSATARRTPEPCETPAPSSALTSPHGKGRYREVESSTVTAPLNAGFAGPRAQEHERYGSRHQATQRTSTQARDRESPAPSPVRPGPLPMGQRRTMVVDELEEISNHHTRYSSDKANVPPSGPPRSSRNGDDREYSDLPASYPSPSHSYKDKSSFVSTEEHERYYQDRPPKPTPYVDGRDQRYPTHREPRYPAQDRDNPRPPPPRAYGGGDRDYVPPASAPPLRPPPPRLPNNGDDREYPIRDLPASRPSSSRPYEDRDYHTPPPVVRSPVRPRSPYGDNYDNSYAPPPARHVDGLNGSFVHREYGPPPAAHKSSFNYDDRRREGWDRPERDDDRELRNRVHEPPYVRGERLDWEHKRDRERDRDPYPDAHGYPGHPSHYVYGPLEHSGNHLAPLPGANRFESRDYLPTSDLYDTREPVPPSHGYSYRNRPPPLPPPQLTPPELYDYDYQRQESARASPPTRQGSYARREPGGRRTEDVDSRQNLRQQEEVACKSEHERAREDRDNTHFRGSPAPVPRPPTHNNSEKTEPARLCRRPYPLHEVARLDAEEQDRHREEWSRRTHEMSVKEEELRRKEDEVAKQAKDAIRRESEARRMGEEAQRKAEEARVKEEQAQRKEAEARRMQDEMARREYEAHTPRRPYSYPPAMLSNRPPSYPEPSNFRSPSPAKRTIATSSTRNESLAVAVNTAVSDSRFELQSLNQPVVESHSGAVMDMGTTRPVAPAGSNTAPERNQILAGAQHTTIVGGMFATVTGNVYHISMTESSGKQIAAVNDDDDSDAESTGDMSLQSTQPAYASAPLLKKHGLICASCFRRRGCNCCARCLCATGGYGGVDGMVYKEED